MTLEIRTTVDGLAPQQLDGFFVGWPDPPAPETHLEILRGSSHVALAIDGERVVGFATAISDGVLAAFIPFLEVLPDCQGRGIGSTLIESLLEQLEEFYIVDLVCDPELESFYAPLGFQRYTAMIRRNYERQSGA